MPSTDSGSPAVRLTQINFYLEGGRIHIACEYTDGHECYMQAGSWNEVPDLIRSALTLPSSTSAEGIPGTPRIDQSPPTEPR